MGNTTVPPSSGTTPPKPDDNLRDIAGIGPATARRLNEAGIQTFVDLAAAAAADIIDLFSDLKGGQRVDAEKATAWIKLAQDKISELDQPLTAASEAIDVAEVEGDTENHQHYATFTIELLLDQANHIRRTKMTHVTNREESLWAGWDVGRMIDFITHQANLNLSRGQAAEKDASALIVPTAIPDTPALTITETMVQKVGGVTHANIIASDQNWSIQVGWTLSGATQAQLTGNWLVRAYLKSVGPGQDYSFPLEGGTLMPLSGFAKAKESVRTYHYDYQINIVAGLITGGVYQLLVSVTSETQIKELGYLATFFEYPSVLQLFHV